MVEGTRGQKSLERALKKRVDGLTGRAWLAGQLDLTESAVSRWCTGKGRPDPHFRRAITALLAIPEEAWWTAEEARVVRKAVRIGPAKYAQAQSARKVTAGSRAARSVGAAQ